jgi:hypothetical protein
VQFEKSDFKESAFSEQFSSQMIAFFFLLHDVDIFLKILQNSRLKVKSYSAFR